MKSTSTPSVFAHAWSLLVRNLSIAVPGIVVGIAAAFIGALFEPSVESLDSNVWSRLAQATVQIVATIISIAYTTGMADAAWRTGHASFADGALAFRRDGGHVFVAMLVLFALGIAAALLGPYTLWLSLVAYIFFCIYTMASAVVGERPGILAVGESIEIAFQRALPTLFIVLGIVAIAFVMGIVAGLIAGTPFVGPLVSEIVVECVVAYLALVLVGEYRLLRGLTV